jgi:hypothetical protein
MIVTTEDKAKTQWCSFVAHGEDRLVQPAFPNRPETRPLEGVDKTERDKNKNGGDDGGLPPGIDRIILGLLARLPKSGEVWPEAEQKLWLDLLAGSFKLIYKDISQKEGGDVR